MEIEGLQNFLFHLLFTYAATSLNYNAGSQTLYLTWNPWIEIAYPWAKET